VTAAHAGIGTTNGQPARRGYLLPDEVPADGDPIMARLTHEEYAEMVRDGISYEDLRKRQRERTPESIRDKPSNQKPSEPTPEPKRQGAARPAADHHQDHEANGTYGRSEDGEDGEDVPPKAERPTIKITTEEHTVNAKAALALGRDGGIYQRGGMLVRVVHDSARAPKGVRRPLAPRIDALPQAILRERLSEAARWVTVQTKGDDEVERDARPPGWCVSAVHARGEWAGVRHLEALIDHPVLKWDGSLLVEHGYDDDTGLLLDESAALPQVPGWPSRQDAIDAVLALYDVVRDFPFATDAHKSAWLAGVLTPLARFAFDGPAPLFLVDSNVRGAGKGLLLSVASLIVTGREFTVAAYTQDQDELRKRITALAVQGDRMVLFDNLDGKFGNATLDAALTATSWSDRLLGVNRTVNCPLYATWYATGNNVSVHADTARRICHIRLESGEERPEERQQFAYPNLIEHVKANRPRLLGAALTILRAYVVAGRPDMRLPAWGSYEGWSALVRAAVVWVGLPDPWQTRLQLQEQADVAAGAMEVLLASWLYFDSDKRGKTAAELCDYLRDPPKPAPEWTVEMRDAVEALVGKLDSRALGFKLRSYRRRVFRGLFLDIAGTQQRAARWAVYPAAEFAARVKHPHHPHHTHSERDPRAGEDGEFSEHVSPKETLDRDGDDFGDAWEG
jgi:hypothetical protein